MTCGFPAEGPRGRRSKHHADGKRREMRYSGLDWSIRIGLVHLRYGRTKIPVVQEIRPACANFQSNVFPQLKFLEQR